MILLNIACFVVIFYVMTIKSQRSLHMLQQNLYNENNRYLKWLKQNQKGTILTYEWIALVLAIISLFTGDILSIILKIVLVILLGIDGEVLKYNRMLENVKKPLVKTARVKRQIITLYVLNLLPFILYGFIPSTMKYMLVLSIILLVANYYVVFLVKEINDPIEKAYYRHYWNSAQRKLASIPGLEVFGITGSYGKTSSKNILASILNTKYIAHPTPKNFNTDVGLMTVINNELTKFDEIFIAEMGAYRVGRINNACNLVNPKYGLLTKIGKAHLETFGSQENIIRTKFELIEHLPSDGIGFLNMDDPLQVNYDLKNKVRIVWYAVHNKKADYYVEEMKCTNKGSVCKIHFKEKNQSYTFETKLLGSHNISNIVSAVAIGDTFGIPVEKMQEAVRSLKPIEHRLELKKIGTIYQIDDAYNSNPIGAKVALEVLDMMPGTKVVVTPGMVELGAEEEEANEEFGKEIAKVADYVILVGEKQTKPIQEGLKKAKYKKDNIIITNDVVATYAMVARLKGKEDIYALYENDLPDIYKE